MRGPGHHDHVDAATGDRTVTTVDTRSLEEVRRDAYQRGVSDERARHKRNPLISILIALCAVLGVAVIALAIWKGSFSGAGQTLDTTAGQAADQARVAGREVADETGEAMQDTGRTLESRGEAGQAPPAGQAQPAPAPAPTTPPAQ
ncbi:MAG TPA: hypothetical protein VF699_11960 [Caulobacteraceae bacterium]|jgi:hypothetical protein